jgi:hypothetical protein
MKDFVSWVIRDPGSIGGESYSLIGEAFWSEEEEEDDDVEEEEEEEEEEEAEE